MVTKDAAFSAIGKNQTSNLMLLYNEQIAKMSCQSSIVVIEHHINIWLSEDCCTLTILKS